MFWLHISIVDGRDVHKSLIGVWVKSRVFGHESESSQKSFNGSLKKSHSQSSCIEIFLFMKLFYRLLKKYMIYDLLCKKRGVKM